MIRFPSNFFSLSFLFFSCLAPPPHTLCTTSLKKKQYNNHLQK